MNIHSFNRQIMKRKLMGMRANPPPLASRIRLTQPTQWNVDPLQGCDAVAWANNGLELFQTIQSAHDFVCYNIDLAGQQGVIQCVDGTYNEAITLDATAMGMAPIGDYDALIIRGNLTNPQNCVINVGGAFNSWCFLAVNARTRWRIEGFTLESTVGAICADGGASVYVGGSNVVGGSPKAAAFASSWGSMLEIVAPYTINHPPGYSGACHWSSEMDGLVLMEQFPITILNNPTYTTGFAVASVRSLIAAGGVVFNGAAQGPQYYLGSSELNNGGVPLPGTSPGYIDSLSKHS